MDSLNIFANRPEKKKEKDRYIAQSLFPQGKYYFPGKNSSSCFEDIREKDKFDRMGIVISEPFHKRGYKNNSNDLKNKNYETDELYNYPESSQYDPMGSYTGRPKNVYETPVQDADDL